MNPLETQNQFITNTAGTTDAAYTAPEGVQSPHRESPMWARHTHLHETQTLRYVLTTQLVGALELDVTRTQSRAIEYMIYKVLPKMTFRQMKEYLCPYDYESE